MQGARQWMPALSVGQGCCDEAKGRTLPPHLSNREMPIQEVCMPATIHEAFAYLRVRDAAQAIAFYVQAFGATERFRLTEPGGRVGHAELQLGPAVLMLSDEYPELEIRGPQSLGGTSFAMHLHVDDADGLVQ